jgi:hypothetical protein
VILRHPSAGLEAKDMTCERVCASATASAGDRLGQVAVALLAAVLSASTAHADEPVPDPRPPRLSFSGFGILGVVHSSEKDADFTSTTFKPGGTGHTHDWSAAVDSLVGGQLTVRPTTKLSAIVQVIAEQKYDDSYRPSVGWANVKYQLTPDFSVRVGRTILPVFLLSDVRQVGYAHPWVRPPIEVYSLVPVSSNDGVDASYRVSIRSVTSTFQVTAGRSDSRFPSDTPSGFATAQSRKGIALADTFEAGYLTVRFNYGRTRLTVPELAPLFEGFRQFGPEGVAIADRYDVDRRLVEFVGAGASYDPGRWFAMGEWGRVRVGSVFGESAGWYGSAGYRVRRTVTPYVTLARVEAKGSRSDPGLSIAGLPPPLAGAAGGLNGALNALLSTKPVQTTVSVGGRWDFRKDAALKLQLDHSQHGTGSAGLLSNLQPGFRPGEGVYLFSASVAVVF